MKALTLIAMLLLGVAASAQSATLADTSFAAVDSVLTNRAAIKTAYTATVIMATTTTKFLADGNLISTADGAYVLLNCGKTDSVSSWTNRGNSAGGIDVFDASGSLIPGRLYFRKDRAVAFIKSLAGF